MKKITILAYLTVFVSVYSGFSQGDVRLYSNLSYRLWGRAERREEVLDIDLHSFRNSMSLPAPEGGFLTAVLFEGELADLVYGKMAPGSSVTDGHSSLSRVDYNGKPAYRLRQGEWGLDVVFSLEETPGQIIEDVEKFYGYDSYNRNLVLQEYRDNRVIRILRGNDLLDRDGELSYMEAMTAATIIGKKFQPFFGIHNGLGMLENIGYLLEEKVPAERRMTLTDELPPKEYEDFVFRVKSMAGSIPENIYILARTLCTLREGSYEYTSPGDFLGRKWGGSRDFSLLFYKVLKEFDYDARLLRISPGTEIPNEYMVVYRSSGGRMWGFMGAEYWTGERFGNWTRIPALYKGQTIKFQELDGSVILSDSDWIYPGSGKWQDSFY